MNPTSNGNETQNQNPVPPVNPNPTPTTPQVEKPSSMGPAVGIIIILVILIAGAFYFWSVRLKPAIETTPSETAREGQNQLQGDDIVAELENVGTSDDLSSIETDLSSTNLESLDEGLDAVAF